MPKAIRKITIITLFPQMIRGFFDESIVKRAVDKKLVDLEYINLRDYAVDRYGSVDDRPYGGGAGMVLRMEPLYRALKDAIKSDGQSRFKRKTVLTSAKGKLFTQKKAFQYSRLDHLVLICGHYEGVDERINKYIDEEISLGDFVMTGGEITASAITDAVVRLVPGVLKKDAATKLESFFEIDVSRLIALLGKKGILVTLQNQGVKKVKLLEYPQYTRPEVFRKERVPRELLTGNHKHIEEWRIRKSFELTLKKRKDLIKGK